MIHTIRNYRSGDIPGITRAINAADSYYNLEDGASDTDMAEIFSMPGLNPEQNVFVAESDGSIIGFGLVRLGSSDEEDGFRTWFQLDPAVRGQGLEEEILQALYCRAEEMLPECKTQKITFNTVAFSQEKERVAAIERVGLVEVRRNWLMVCPDLENTAEPRFPDGIIARPYKVGADDVKVHQADNEAFRDHWGHAENPFEMWQHYIARPAVKPDLSIVAEDPKTGEVAGFCTVAINDDENARLGLRRGWIDILAVRRPYRKQGLGTALILTGMRNIRGAHAEQAALGCDAENLTGATRIYKRVGFQVHRERMIYNKPMTRSRAL